MAKVESKSLVRHLRGKLGDLVLRKQGDGTVAQLRSKKRTKFSRAQEQGQSRFKQAADYARTVLADPWQQRLYQKLGAQRKQPPNALLISNFLTPPTVDAIDPADYRRRKDGLIRVLADDLVEVTGVVVKIRDADEAVLEEGPATKVHGVWVYTARQDAPARERLTIEATATNRPGHGVTATIAG